MTLPSEDSDLCAGLWNESKYMFVFGGNHAGYFDLDSGNWFPTLPNPGLRKAGCVSYNYQGEDHVVMAGGFGGPSYAENQVFRINLQRNAMDRLPDLIHSRPNSPSITVDRVDDPNDQLPALMVAGGSGSLDVEVLVIDNSEAWDLANDVLAEAKVDHSTVSWQNVDVFCRHM